MARERIPSCSVFSCHRITRGKSTTEGKTAKQKRIIVDFILGKLAKCEISGEKFYYTALFRWKILKVIFSRCVGVGVGGGGGRGGGVDAGHY